MAEVAKSAQYPKSTPMVRLYFSVAMWTMIVGQQAAMLYMAATREVLLPPADWSMVFLTSGVWLGIAAETDVPAIIRKTPRLKSQLRLLVGSQYFLGLFYLAQLQGMTLPLFLTVGISSALIVAISAMCFLYCLDYVRGLEP